MQAQENQDNIPQSKERNQESAHHKKSSLSQNNVSGQGSLNLDHNDQKNHTRKSGSRNRLSQSSTQSNPGVNELKGSNHASKCPEHSQDELQFYCLNDNRLLCSECMVLNHCIGHQVINVKRASAKIRRRIEELLCEMDAKVNMYSLWEKKIQSNKEDFNETISSLNEHIIANLNDLRKKIDAKQAELTKGVERIVQERSEEFHASLEYVKGLREEVQKGKHNVENSAKTLDDVNICDYYSKKNQLIARMSSTEGVKVPEEVASLINRQEYQEQLSVRSFQEEVELLANRIASLKGIEQFSEIDEINKIVIFDSFESSDHFDKRFTSKDNTFLDNRNRKKPSVNVTKNLDNIFKANQLLSPLDDKSDIRSPSPIKKFQADEKRELLQKARSQQIFSMLDRVFDGNKRNKLVGHVNRQQKDKHANHQNDIEKKHINAEDQDQQESPDKAEVDSVKDILAENQPKKDSGVPLGHSPVYEKNKLFRTSFVPSLKPPKLSLEISLSSPKGVGARSPKYSSILKDVQRTKTKYAWENDMRNIKLSTGLTTRRQSGAKDFDNLRTYIGQKRGSVTTKAGLNFQRSFFT